MPSASARYKLKDAFALDAKALSEIATLLRDRVGECKVTLRTKDQVDREYSSAPDASSYRNLRGKEIVDVSIGARSDDWSKSAKIDFGENAYGTIGVDLAAREDVLLRLKESIEDIISSTKPWYSILTRVDVLLLIVVLLLSMVAMAGLLDLFGLIDIESTRNQNRAAVANAIGLGLAAMGVVGNKIRDVLFPKATFLIGQGVDRHEFLEKIRWGVVIAFIMSFAASAFWTFF